MDNGLSAEARGRGFHGDQKIRAITLADTPVSRSMNVSPQLMELDINLAYT